MSEKESWPPEAVKINLASLLVDLAARRLNPLKLALVSHSGPFRSAIN